MVDDQAFIYIVRSAMKKPFASEFTDIVDLFSYPNAYCSYFNTGDYAGTCDYGDSYNDCPAEMSSWLALGCNRHQIRPLSNLLIIRCDVCSEYFFHILRRGHMPWSLTEFLECGGELVLLYTGNGPRLFPKAHTNGKKECRHEFHLCEETEDCEDFINLLYATLVGFSFYTWQQQRCARRPLGLAGSDNHRRGGGLAVYWHKVVRGYAFLTSIACDDDYDEQDAASGYNGVVFLMPGVLSIEVLRITSKITNSQSGTAEMIQQGTTTFDERQRSGFEMLEIHSISSLRSATGILAQHAFLVGGSTTSNFDS
ncbi:hypothetical protein EDC04DRAFT_2598078 [Pisolithus marmoratus]|nr:hypothetical protein EDC04DRAFT_2598078 [Pisolithus marmoratus]